MIHSPSRSKSEAFAGVGLLNHPQRISDFSGVVDFGDTLTRGTTTNTMMIKNRYFGNLYMSIVIEREFRTFSALSDLFCVTRGDALRFAQRLPWLSYRAPL